ncbi:aspartate/glutamate racemase family protein [Sinorhizobium meliloti]|uniref:aspartate/glutamate racemase family protein n=1 Tax=Rhizobium meliloti TaxID=382 RepID=UPI002D79E2A4|nr:aspartate/glutamate racemase family protein [Sinorhizobium meliloti]
MGDTARTVAATGRDIVLTTSRSGAASIEGHYDKALSILGVIDEIAQGEPADAYIIGCFGDPGMSNLMERLSHRLAVLDIDGVAAAVKFAGGIVGMGLRTSKVGDLAYPYRKPTPVSCRNTPRPVSSCAKIMRPRRSQRR